ncbi:SH3 domain-containing protein [Roseococcus sp. SYP-B2431]|uniref:SH3 domain-containing protein n=1 Tax=Roseococcus sp. SYP-B2431 TaxID=2496640 RepID=UPI00103AD203|nr:SH3 domain-containing protein [Roseococcus sp. SYP-B2431]TCH99523.1 SH3 domain-containing protein [Roseococcus sp. SYP-B2431]
MRAPALSALALSLIALAACGEQQAASEPSSGRQQAARAAAEASLQARLRGQGAQQRGVQVFAQALPDTLAICGRTTMTGASGAPYVPYVAVVSFEGESPRVANLVLGATGPEASRVFVEMTDRCFDGGGPATARVMARSFPPLPVPGAPQAEGEAAAEVAAAPEPARPASTVMVSSRSAANLRSATRNGEVIRTLPPSSTLEVIGEAPGGWYQVGDRGSAMGWVHASVLETPPR